MLDLRAEDLHREILFETEDPEGLRAVDLERGSPTARLYEEEAPKGRAS